MLKRLLILALIASLPAAAAAASKITLYALFKDKAILLVDGNRRVVKSGESTPEGVKLIATDTEQEEVEIELEGRRERLKLGVVVANFAPSGKGSVTLFVEPNGHFHADGTINDVAVRFLVDTGATSIAMSSAHANRVGIDYQRKGKRGYATTASGVVRMYSVKLEKVQVGTITLFDVEAGVIEGNFPVEILLGMSFLSRVDMKRDGDKLELTQRF